MGDALTVQIASEKNFPLDLVVFIFAPATIVAYPPHLPALFLSLFPLSIRAILALIHEYLVPLIVGLLAACNALTSHHSSDIALQHAAAPSDWFLSCAAASM